MMYDVSAIFVYWIQNVAAPSIYLEEDLWTEYLLADEQLELDAVHAMDQLHNQILPSQRDGEEVHTYRILPAIAAPNT